MPSSADEVYEYWINNVLWHTKSFLDGIVFRYTSMEISDGTP